MNNKQRLVLLFFVLSTALVMGACSGGQTAAPVDQSVPSVPTLIPTEAPAGDSQPADDQTTDSGEPAATPTIDINCTETNPHPMGQSIADTYGVTYEEVMTWFCAGDTFEDIVNALLIKDETDLTVEELLDLNREKGWDQVWKDLGLAP